MKYVLYLDIIHFYPHILVDLIIKKRNGGEHSPEEIAEIIRGYTEGSLPDYQMSAWLMAVYFKGLSDKETSALIRSMMKSGEVLDLSEIPGIKVDKHSTGGVGDKTTLILAPWVAAAGIPVAKMSGRGLGHTGGTLDKLESIPGFHVDISKDDFIRQVSQHHIAICSQTQNLVPADKKLYALRDVTGTVDNISLIAASVMSKKLASGADAIVIDLKVGDGAFIKDLEEAEKLAHIMMSSARTMERKITVVVSNMNQPLGHAIGNVLEVSEAISVLKGKGPKDLTDLCLALGTEMLLLSGKFDSAAEAESCLIRLLEEGAAYRKFEEWIQIQGGNVSVLSQSDLLPSSSIIYPFRSRETGYVHELKAHHVGLASMKLGAGRETKESPIDYGAGIMLLKKVGDKVEAGEILAELHTSVESSIEKACHHLNTTFVIKPEAPHPDPLILKIIK